MGFLPKKQEVNEVVNEVPVAPVTPEIPVAPTITQPIETKAYEPEVKKEKTVVVRELPTQAVRKGTAEDGTILNLITIEEALTEIMNS